MWVLLQDGDGVVSLAEWQENMWARSEVQSEEQFIAHIQRLTEHVKSLRA